MAVIISGMENVPGSCFDCDLHNYHFCDSTGNCIEQNMDDNTRADDCPLKELPSGKWKHISYYDGGYGMNETCSNCGCTIHGQIFDLVDKYCPNCGCKMESEDNNGSNNN